MTHHIPLNVDDLKDLRDEIGLGFPVCKSILIGREMRVMLANAKTIEDLKPLMAEIIDSIHPDADRY